MTSPNHPPLPMLITGIAGVAGFNAFHYFRRRYGDKVIGVRQPSMWPLSGPGIIPCELTDSLAVQQLWQEHRFGSVISSLGSCRLKSCETDPDMAYRVNVLGTENVLRHAARYDARVLHTSIDLVFAGREPDESHSGYVETDRADPVTVYGAMMVRAEQVVLDQCPDACVLRISLPMGISFNGHAGAIDWIASRFKQGKPATLYFDEVRTPTFTDCLCRLLADLLNRPLAGIYHAGGPRRISLYQIAQVVNVVGGHDPSLLHGCMRRQAGPMPPRAGDVSLNCDKLVEYLGRQPFDPWPIDDRLVPTHRDWHHAPDDLPEDFQVGEQSVAQLLYQNPRRPEPVPKSRRQQT
ncbi:SDR family oxidoreductase [Stieleria varia]|uniref:dTDP-4-dehydrorhamnose reductase n=1 Tax=Stieleria varia TaxID=2528005 RepID=A0A5C6AX76_9BACT|nr:sugar nucleotide-binding protein [Stieleria varia]TWU04543.1 dTDP-4-dehydrorhamnose reductase [Stieleria varia]